MQAFLQRPSAVFFLYSSAQFKTNLTYPFLLLVIFVFVFLFRRFHRFHSQGREWRRLHAGVRKIWRIQWIRRDRYRTLQTHYFYFISFACSSIILCFSLSFFIARVDSASDSFSLFSISACKFFCSRPPQCSSCIHQHNSKRIRFTLSSSSSFSFSSSFFVVFIPRADRGVVYMRVFENLANLVDSSWRISDSMLVTS